MEFWTLTSLLWFMYLSLLTSSFITTSLLDCCCCKKKKKANKVGGKSSRPRKLASVTPEKEATRVAAAGKKPTTIPSPPKTQVGKKTKANTEETTTTKKVRSKESKKSKQSKKAKLSKSGSPKNSKHSRKHKKDKDDGGDSESSKGALADVHLSAEPIKPRSFVLDEKEARIKNESLKKEEADPYPTISAFLSDKDDD
ncbi:unnamed protein product [Meloidogyne enterolobii]|uniref:Uncharacterized protein n=3 Tax=Meloidogyne enterolobii TaxID=390850 RepID=A0ACB1B582_MELEN|nr:unnamed protein product [Meloidogyne enterolobii]